MASKGHRPQYYSVRKLNQSATTESEVTTTFRIEHIPTTTTMENKKTRVRKVIVGKPKHCATPETEKVLMIVGATGAGKSTLINGMVNYIMGVQYEDNSRYKLIDDEGSGSQAHSQTKWITAYTFHKRDEWKLPYTLTIIDTPGFGDTEGLERDKKITNQIREFFSVEGTQGIDHLNSIGFVVQAPQARLTPTQRYIFDSILSIFGKDIGQNIFMMVTFADGKKPPVLAAIKAAKLEFQKSFKFNNSALFTKEEKEDSDDEGGDDDEDQDEERDNDNMSFNLMFWKMGEKSYKDFFGKFGKTKSVSLQLTREVLQEREHLECVIQSLQQNIQAGLSKADQLHQEERIIRHHESDLLKNKDFTYEITLTKQRQVGLQCGAHVTNCLKCNRTCHYPCAIPKDEDKNNCAAMGSDGHCEVCSGGCYWDNHVNNQYRFELYEEKETRTSEDLKSRYEDAESKKTAVENVTAGLKKDLDNLYLTVFSMIRQANGILRRLEEIALRPNPLTEIEYIELLIQSEKAEAKPGFQRRIAALNIVQKEAKILAGIKDKIQLEQKLKHAANYCWSDVKFW